MFAHFLNGIKVSVLRLPGLFSGPDWPVLFRGEATGFLTAAAGAGLAASGVAVAAVVGLCVGERPAGLGAIAGLGGSLGLSGLGLDSAAAAAAGGAASSSLASGGGGGGGGAGAVMACRGFSCQVW